MVAAELRDHPYADANQILVIRNYGPSIARNVRVTFDPPIPEPDNPAESGAPFLKARYATPLAVLTPGMELDNVYFSGRRQGGTWVNYEPMPEQVMVRIEYEDDQGNDWADDFPLDTDIIRNRTYTTSSRDPDEQRKALLKAVQGIEKALDQ